MVASASPCAILKLFSWIYSFYFLFFPTWFKSSKQIRKVGGADILDRTEVPTSGE
jgi:hypothetical protein